MYNTIQIQEFNLLFFCVKDLLSKEKRNPVCQPLGHHANHYATVPITLKLQDTKWKNRISHEAYKKNGELYTKKPAQRVVFWHYLC